MTMHRFPRLTFSASLLAALTVSGALAGCAHQSHWIKDGNAATDATMDQKDCDREAARMAMQNGTVGSRDPGTTQYDMFRRCMRERGYQSAPVK